MYGRSSKDAMGNDDISWHIVMEIEPFNCCADCGCRKWSTCVVDTSKREDLATGAIVAGWRGRSECKICGSVAFWTFNPDRPVISRQMK